MKTLATSFFICLGISAITAFATIRLENCSCSAADGSCTASISCRGGCIAFCPSGGCYARCSGNYRLGEAGLSQAVTSSLKGRDSRERAAERARHTGKEVVLNPTPPHPTFNLDAQNVPLWDINNILASDGSIQVSKEDSARLKEVRRALLNGERMSVCFGHISAKSLADELSFITGLNVNVKPGGASALINYSAKDVTLDEIAAQVSKLSGVQFSIR